MAKIILQNNRTHDITIHLAGDNNLVSSVKIPAAKQNPEDREKIVPGKAEADADLVAAARKKFPVVNHYFTEGWLKEVSGSGSPVNAGASRKS
jgi:hypothetical protein